MSGERVNNFVGNWIFFLKLGSKFPPSYNMLVSRFLENGITIIPVDIKQYLAISRRVKKSSMIVLEDSIERKAAFREIFKNNLEFHVKSSILYIFHISSFMPVVFKSNMKMVWNYNYIRLPFQVDKTVDDISYRYIAQKLEVEKWPGGKRAPLLNMSA